jgi:cobalt-zinc-cadmium efflux system outer membrane protein
MRGLMILALSAATVGCQVAPNKPAGGRPWSPLPVPPPAGVGFAPAPAIEVPGTVVPPSVAQAGARGDRPVVSPAGGFSTPPATAESPVQKGPASPPPVGATTLADFENLAAANNPTIAAAEALIRQQEGLLRQETLYPNPTVGYLRSDPDQPGKSATQGVFVSQDIVTSNKLGLAGAAQREDVEARRWQLAAQRGRVANDVRIRFLEVLGAQETVRVAEELESLAQEGVAAAQELAKAQQAAKLDVLQAEIQLNAVRTAVQDAKYRHQAAWRQLANVVGVPDLQPAALAADLEQETPPLDWEQSWQRLLAASPVLKAQEATIRAAGVDVRLAKAQAVPNVNVQLVVQRDRVEKFTSISPLVSVPLPIFNRNQGNIQNAAALLAQQRSEHQRITLALRDQLAAAFQQYQSARGQADRLKTEIIPRAKQNLELTTQGYKSGQFDIARVLAARQTYYETKTAYIDARTVKNRVAAEIEGLELTGGLNPTEIGTALQTPLGPGGAGSRSVLLNQLQQRGGGGSQLLPGALQGR